MEGGLQELQLEMESAAYARHPGASPERPGGVGRSQVLLADRCVPGLAREGAGQQLVGR